MSQHRKYDKIMKVQTRKIYHHPNSDPLQTSLIVQILRGRQRHNRTWEALLEGLNQNKCGLQQQNAMKLLLGTENNCMRCWNNKTKRAETVASEVTGTKAG